MINTMSVNIVTLEDPVEYFIEGINQSQINSEIGLTFAAGLRSILRQDPNVIMVGEVRDKETAELAVHAALTGHLVLSTLHTNDAVSTPSRLIDMGVPGFMIATTLRAVLSQRLLRLVCKECADPHELTPDETVWVKRYFGEVPSHAKLLSGRGCSACNGSGYRGRMGIFELLEMTPELAVVLHKEDPVEFEAVARKQIGKNSIMHNGFELVFQGLTTVSEVTKNALMTE